MTGREKINAIWDILTDKTQKFDEDKQDEKQEDFVDVETEDGKVLRVADIAEGQPVEIVEGENLVEAPDGTYVLTTGESIVVVDSMISEVVPAEEQEEEMAEDSKEESKEETKEEEIEEKLESNDEVLELVKGIAKEVADLKSKFKSQDEAFEEFKAAASVEHTDTRVRFTEKKEDATPKSKLHQITGR